MKIIFSFLIAATFALAALAGELDGTKSTTILSGGTNKVVALSTNGFYSIDIPRAKDVSMFCSFKYLNAVSTGDVNALTVDLYRGMGNGIWESNVWATWTVSANATTTTANGQMTNFALPSVPYLRFKIANVSTNAHATNVTFSYDFKN